ncbi:MAG: PadR family transcriptional regulator [Clostridia bacterium]|nr:PadR family transcriptional regulator [Clostridia bacterium]
MNSQFKKGILELLVLNMLKKSDCYGYEIVNKISITISISEGTIYPLLRRLKTDGYVTTYLSESTEGPPRKYYHLSDKGIIEHDKLKGEWDTFSDGVNILLGEEL